MRRFKTLLAVAACIWLACKGLPHLPSGPGEPLPSPSPITTPSPSNRITEPLRTQGDRFIPPILGSIICCSDGVDEHQWPLFDTQTIDELAAHGANWTHLRLGPYGPQEGFEGYLKFGGRFDLNQFNDAYWQRVESLVAYAAEKGVYVEVDLVDGWVLKPEYRNELSPWAGRNNSSGISYGCDLLLEAPPPPVQLWVRHAVDTLGRYPNVVWEVGNETGVCGSSRDWEDGIARLVRGAGSNLLIGSNSDDPSYCPSCSYDSYHQRELCGVAGRPCQVNEFQDIPVEVWAALAREGWASGRPFHMWRSGNWSAADNQKALRLLEEIVHAHP